MLFLENAWVIDHADEFGFGTVLIRGHTSRAPLRIIGSRLRLEALMKLANDQAFLCLSKRPYCLREYIRIMFDRLFHCLFSVLYHYLSTSPCDSIMSSHQSLNFFQLLCDCLICFDIRLAIPSNLRLLILQEIDSVESKTALS